MQTGGRWRGAWSARSCSACRAGRNARRRGHRSRGGIFSKRLYAGYKTSEGVAQELLSQFPILEEALDAMGVVVWPMVEFEADDALASAAAKAAIRMRRRVIICTPDKDSGQCVVGTRVVQLDRQANISRDEAGVVEKFGVQPKSIPDYLAVVGDSADGFPGVRWLGREGRGYRSCRDTSGWRTSRRIGMRGMRRLRTHSVSDVAVRRLGRCDFISDARDIAVGCAGL